jgi:hypothetical protein
MIKIGKEFNGTKQGEEFSDVAGGHLKSTKITNCRTTCAKVVINALVTQ